MYGDGWSKDNGTFDDWGSNGYTARNCISCGCTTCCAHVKASGFSKDALNQIYLFTGHVIKGRHLYVEQNQEYGIWFDGEYGGAASWIIGPMSNIAGGQLTYGWAFNNENTSCPSSSKVWEEWWNSQWQYSETATVECSLGW